MKAKKLFLNLIFLLGIFSLFTMTNSAFATVIASGTGSAGDMQVVLCNILKFVTGGIGKTIAAFIIIGVGIGFFIGKVTWGLLIGVTLGISAMFGAPAIVGALTGGTANYCA